MIFTGHILSATPNNGQLHVIITNVSPPHKPDWRECCPDMEIDVPLNQQTNFNVGREVEIMVMLKREK